MSPGQLEFAITQYLDGTLPPEQWDAIRNRLGSDPQAQAYLAEHEKLTALLRSQPLPDLDWTEVARDLSAVVTGSVDESSRAEDQKLNAILKAATPLPALRWDELSRRISAAVDTEVAATTAVEDQRLDNLLRSAPMPAINWERLAVHISDAVAKEGKVEERHESADVVGRIGFVTRFARIAIAASVVLVGGIIAIVASRNGGGSTPKSGDLPVGPSNRIAQVDIFPVEKIEQPAVAEIQIGPSPAYAAAESELNRRGVASRSPVVIVTPAGPDEDDLDHAPGMFD